MKNIFTHAVSSGRLNFNDSRFRNLNNLHMKKIFTLSAMMFLSILAGFSQTKRVFLRVSAIRNGAGMRLETSATCCNLLTAW